MAIQLQDIEKLPIDFEEIMSVLKDRIQARLPSRWTDFLMSNFGVELLEAVAYEATLMNYYVNASLNEAFLPTAKTSHAVHNLARTIGYKPKKASQSVVPVIITLNEPAKSQIYIPKYTIFSTSTGIKFYSYEDSMFEKGSQSITINCKSGILVTDIIISNAIAKNRYKLKKSNIIAIEKVTAENFEFEYLDFIDRKEKKPYYTLEYNSKNDSFLIFGDNVYGINPPEGMMIEVLYVVNNTSVENNNVLPGTINLIDSILYTVNGEIVTDVTVTNQIAASGGAPAESLDEIKRNAPSINRTQHRAVTRQDFKDLVLALQQIEKVSIIDYYNLEEVGIFGVKVCPVQLGGGYMSRLAKEELTKYLEEKKIISTQVSVIDPSYITFDVNVVLQANQISNINILTNQVRKKIIEYMSWKNREFGQEVSKSELQRKISEIPEVLQIYNIGLEENRRIYITDIIYEENSTSTNKIKFNDSINIIRTGSKIMIADKNHKIALRAVVGNIDLNGIVTLSENITIESDISIGSEIYPLQKVLGDYKFGSKEIALRHEFVFNDERFYFELKEEYEQLLANMNSCTIYFESQPTEFYTIMYRTGEKVYLNRPITHSISNGENVYIVYKRSMPSLSAIALPGHNKLRFINYPRFGRNTILNLHSYDNYEISILQMTRSHNISDYLDVYYDTSNMLEISKIYISDAIVFEKDKDYILERENKTITWTELGRQKIVAGTKYYISVVKKLSAKIENKQSFNVTKIDGKYATISPLVKETLYENATFIYETDTFNLLPYEIADIGNIKVDIV